MYLLWVSLRMPVSSLKRSLRSASEKCLATSSSLSTTQELRAFLCACLWNIFSSIVPVCNKNNNQSGTSLKSNTQVQFTNRTDMSVTFHLYSSPNIVRVIKSRRTRGARHVAHMGDLRGLYRVLVGKPEGRRLLGTPRW